MKLFEPRKTRGFWLFENTNVSYDYSMIPDNRIMEVLKVLLTELISSKLLLPKEISGVQFNFKNKTIDEIIDIINESNLLNDAFEFSIYGDTVIYTNVGEEVHSGIFSVESFRTFQQSFVLETKSDVWLPMAFDENKFEFVWNLERYKLNNNRLTSILQKINDSLKWNEPSDLREHNEIGALQIGFNLFLNKEVIIQEYNTNPNKDFNLSLYLSQLSKY